MDCRSTTGIQPAVSTDMKKWMSLKDACERAGNFEILRERLTSGEVRSRAASFRSLGINPDGSEEIEATGIQCCTTDIDKYWPIS